MRPDGPTRPGRRLTSPGLHALAVLLAATTPATMHAQPTVPLPGGPGGQFELRTDVRWSGRPDLTAAVGWVRPLNRALRAGGILGGGVERDAAGDRWSAVAEGHVRFHLDPYAERRWGWYGVAGLGVRVTEAPDASGTAGRGYLLLLGGVEGPPLGERWRGAIEFGIADGARLGLVLRRARERAR